MQDIYLLKHESECQYWEGFVPHFVANTYRRAALGASKMAEGAPAGDHYQVVKIYYQSKTVRPVGPLHSGVAEW